MKLGKLLLPIVAALVMSACALLPDNSTTADAKSGVKLALTAYADIYQPGVLIYGRTPVCPTQAPVCHDPAVLARLKAADLTVTNAITKAQGVMEGTASDSGQLSDVMKAIVDAEAAIAKSGALSIH